MNRPKTEYKSPWHDGGPKKVPGADIANICILNIRFWHLFRRCPRRGRWECIRSMAPDGRPAGPATARIPDDPGRRWRDGSRTFSSRARAATRDLLSDVVF